MLLRIEGALNEFFKSHNVFSEALEKVAGEKCDFCQLEIRSRIRGRFVEQACVGGVIVMAWRTAAMWFSVWASV